VWVYLQHDAFLYAGIPALEEGMNMMMSGHRPSVCMRGTKWQASWADGTAFTIRSSPQATRPLMASIAMRWQNPPVTLKKEGGQAFAVENLETRSNSFVYLVQLLTFEATSNGAHYFKIGKATSIPSRIRQFGPCELVARESHRDERSALHREKELHKKFAAYRKPKTEIFLLTPEELRLVIEEMRELPNDRQINVAKSMV
jgi:predicted GIY-YIG superfamily endonuclease